MTNITTTTTIACVLFLIIVTYFVLNIWLKKNPDKDYFILALCILQIISLFFIYFNNNTKEGFETLDQQYNRGNLFYVSPQRQQCLIEQVSLQQSPRTRSCNCCCIGTTGGNLKYVQQWRNANNNINWHRTDNWTRNRNNNAYRTQLAPTSLL
jgi:hypothetical protein